MMCFLFFAIEVFTELEPGTKADWTMIILTLFATLIAFSAAYAAWENLKEIQNQYHLDKKNSSSQFYLIEIKKYFDLAVNLISNKNINYIAWSQAVDLLKTSHNILRKKITNKSHKIIYLIDYINTGYILKSVLEKMSEQNCFSNIPPDSSSKINSESLVFLLNFINIASKVRFDLEIKNTDIMKVYNTHILEDLTFDFDENNSLERTQKYFKEITQFIKAETKLTPKDP